MKSIHNKGDSAVADTVSVSTIVTGYATLTHIYNAKNCSTVLHNHMLLSQIVLLHEKNYTTSVPLYEFNVPLI
ncbi:MAG: hypothetical protein J5767_13130 [Paludibacteraceae bacterium]|nr:hypothetical protein [Paludibacteraceae bacterium]